jgi:Spy/CpxP family protein refolding chaperone
MNKLKGLILGSAVFALSAGTVVAASLAAAPDGSGRGPRPFARGDRMHGGFGGAPIITMALNNKTELNLTNDQVSNLEKIRTNFQSQVTPLQQQVRSIEKEIANLSQQPQVNLIQIKSKIQDAEKFRSELRYLRLEALENGKSVLTAQQRDQLKTLVRSRHEHMRRPQGQPS